MSAVGMLGQLPPHPEDTHPRVRLGSHLDTEAMAPTPAVVDYASKVRVWPIYLNDRLSDCTCAGICHSVQAWTAYAKGLVTLPTSACLSLYERMGYIPGNAATDMGAVEQDVLAEVCKNGVGGHKILAYAQVDHKNLDEMKAALNMFGSLYLGADMPKTALTQTESDQPWTVVPGSSIEGGHCFVAQRWDVAPAPMSVVTWGAVQRVTADWWLTYGIEAWIVITEDWFLANGKTVTGLNLAGLGAEFAAISGGPNPFASGPKSKLCFGVRDKLRKFL